MSGHYMDVILLNTPQPGVDRGTLIRNLAATFKKESSAISNMLSQPRTRIKKNVEEALANRYKNIIETAGGQCELVSHSELSVAVHDEQASRYLPPTEQVEEQLEQQPDSTAGAMNQLAGHAYPENLASQAHPAAKNKVAAIIVSCFVFVMLIGILTAIAIPAYQDYTLREKIADSMPLIDQTRKQLTAFIKKTDQLPKQNSQAGLPEVINSEFIGSIRLLEGALLEVTFNISALPATGNTIIWLPVRHSDEILWSCKGGTLAERYRPQECRGGVAELSEKKEGKPSARLSKKLFSTDQHLSLNVPQEWSLHSKLSADAAISVANINEAAYALVIKEPKQDFASGFSLSEYTNVIVSLMKENIKDARTPGELRHFTINGFPAEQLILTGVVNKIKIGYVLTTIESEHGFYQVVAWTLVSRLKEDHPLLRSIGRSLVVHRDFDEVVAEI